MKFKNKTTKIKFQMVAIFIGQFVLTWVPLVMIGVDLTMFSNVATISKKLNFNIGSDINFYNLIGMGPF
jgi:hypothetical protein